MSCLLCRVFHIALSLKHSEWKPFLTGWLHAADKPAGIKNGSGSSTSGISVVFRKQTCCPGALSDLFVQFMLLVIYQQKKLEVAVLLFSWLDSSWTSLNASKTHRLIKEHCCWGTSGCIAAQILICYSEQQKIKHQKSHWDQALAYLCHQVFSCSQHIRDPWCRRRKTVIEINRHFLRQMPVPIQVD